MLGFKFYPNYFRIILINANQYLLDLKKSHIVIKTSGAEGGIRTHESLRNSRLRAAPLTMLGNLRSRSFCQVRGFNYSYIWRAAAGNRTPAKGSTDPYASITPQRPREETKSGNRLKGFRDEGGIRLSS